MCSLSASSLPNTATVPPVPPPVIFAPYKPALRAALAHRLDQEIDFVDRQPAIVAVALVRAVHALAGGDERLLVARARGAQARP